MATSGKTSQGLVGGPMRIAGGDFPDRAWMLGLADHHLQKALAYDRPH